jgi:hypothetical protein
VVLGHDHGLLEDNDLDHVIGIVYDIGIVLVVIDDM